MSLGTSLTIAAKELKVLRRTRSIFAYTVALPVFISVIFSIYISSLAASGLPSTYSLGLTMLTFVFVILAAVLPSAIAAYSIVGEKIEKSLEPMLTTPTTDGEILLGKTIAAFLPPILATWAGALIFMAATDYVTHSALSFYYFPNWNAAIMLLILAPLAALSGIGLAIIASSRLGDVRAANQIAGLVYLPFLFLFVAGSTGAITLDVGSLLSLAVILIIVDMALFYLSRAIFKREEILTKWN
jgi:ABC-2 type transport system permease protein